MGIEEREDFMKQVQLYRNKVPSLFTITAKTMLKTSHPSKFNSINIFYKRWVQVIHGVTLVKLLFFSLSLFIALHLIKEHTIFSTTSKPYSSNKEHPTMAKSPISTSSRSKKKVDQKFLNFCLDLLLQRNLINIYIYIYCTQCNCVVLFKYVNTFCLYVSVKCWYCSM